jgi:autotransporter-associated beta strand protein
MCALNPPRRRSPGAAASGPPHGLQARLVRGLAAVMLLCWSGSGWEPSAATAADVNFTGGEGGASNLWNTATNWSTGAVPTSSDVAVFGSPTASNAVLVTANNVGGLLISRAQPTAVEGTGQTTFTTNAAGITVQAESGAFTYGSDQTASQVRQLIAVSQTWTNASSSAFTVAAAGSAVRLSDGATLTLAGSGDFIFNKGFTQQGSPNASVIWEGSGRIDLNLSSAGLLGGFVLRSGTVSIGQNNALGGTSGTGPVTAGSVVLESTSSRTINNAFTLVGDLGFGGPGNLTVSNSNPFNLGGATRTIAVTSATLAIQGSVIDGGIVKSGPGVLSLSGANAYSGPTTVAAGTLAVASTAALPGWDTSGRYTVQSGARLTVGAGFGSGDIGTVLGTGNLQSGATIAIDVGETPTTLATGVPAEIRLAKVGAGTLILTGENTPADTMINGGTLQVGNGGATGSLTGNVANGGTIAFNRSDDVRFDGLISGAGSVVKTGAGSLTLSADNTFSGAVTVNQGTLVVTGVNASVGTVSVASGGTLGGTGTIAGTTTIGAGGTMAPGSSPGMLSLTGSVRFAGGGNYNWEISDATGTAGETAGWDLVDIGGGLDIAATSESPFSINLWSLSGVGPDVNGPAANFSPTQNGSWRIASAAGGITGFAADKFLINVGAANGAAGFANDLAGGAFSLVQADNDLNLVFTAAAGPAFIVIDVPSGQTRTQAEAGYQVLSGATPVRKTGAGTLVLDATNSLSSSVAVTEGTAVAANTQPLGTASLDVSAGATFAIAPAVGAANAVRLTALGDIAGRIDVGSGRFSLPASSESPATELRSLLVSGRNGGTWDGGAGIVSNAAAAAGGTRAVGYVVSTDGSAVVAFAAPGDTNLNGQVDVFDLVSINSGGKYGTGQTAVWNQGDFNYDGVTNVFDLVGINTAGAYGQGNYLPAAPAAASAAAVPEPAVQLIGLAAAAGAVWLASRRRGVARRR